VIHFQHAIIFFQSISQKFLLPWSACTLLLVPLVWRTFPLMEDALVTSPVLASAVVEPRCQDRTRGTH